MRERVGKLEYEIDKKGFDDHLAQLKKQEAEHKNNMATVASLKRSRR